MKTNPRPAIISVGLVLIVGLSAFATSASSPTVVVTPMLPTVRPQLSTVRPTSLPIATVVKTATPKATSVSLPEIELKPSESYFRVGGVPTLLLGRNITGIDAADYATLLGWADKGGTNILRLHLTFGWWATPWMQSNGDVNEDWAENWDKFFDQANTKGIYIIPVFGVWAEWNDGTPDYGSDLWIYNPLNFNNGGLVREPGDIFTEDSEAQELWLKWLGTLVERWQVRPNIAAWEIFSELNIASGAPAPTDAQGGVNEAEGIAFTERAAKVIRAADSYDRPITTSLAGVYQETDKWADFYNLDTLDFIQIHPYASDLDVALISEVRQKLDQYHKPVMIGESGLSAFLTANTFPPEADRGIKHAIWAGIVSGALNGRTLWFEDGYAVYWDPNNKSQGFAYMKRFAETEKGAANFVAGVDFADLKPLTVTLSSRTKVWGGAIGRDDYVIGWFRDSMCKSPEWALRPLISNQSISLNVPGSAANWQVDFYDTTTGTKIGSAHVVRSGGTVIIPLPDFVDDIAFKMYVK